MRLRPGRYARAIRPCALFSQLRRPAAGRSKPVGFDPQTLQHGDEQVGQRGIVLSIEGDVATVRRYLGVA